MHAYGHENMNSFNFKKCKIIKNVFKMKIYSSNSIKCNAYKYKQNDKMSCFDLKNILLCIKLKKYIIE